MPEEQKSGAFTVDPSYLGLLNLFYNFEIKIKVHSQPSNSRTAPSQKSSIDAQDLTKSLHQQTVGHKCNAR